MNYLGALIISMFHAFSADAAQIDVSDGLRIRNAIDVATNPVQQLLFDSTVRRRLDNWLTEPTLNAYVIDCQFRLRPFFQSTSIIGPLCYTLRQPAPRRAQALQIIERYLLELTGALYELKSDPRASVQEREKAARMFKHFWDLNTRSAKTYRKEFEECLKPAMNVKYAHDGTYTYSPFQSVSACFQTKFPKESLNLLSGHQAMMPVFALNLAREFRNQPGHAVSPTGWIGGNRVEYHMKNDVSSEMLAYLEKSAPLIEQFYPLQETNGAPGRGSLSSMRSAHHSQIFTPEEGFPSVTDHPVWSQSSGIFHQLLTGVNSAKESIFINIFFLGGTMGAALAKHLVALMDQNPALKVFIIRDNINHFGHRAEMLPVFHFLLAESYRRPNQLVVAEAYIEGRKSGLPKFMQDLVTDRLLSVTGLQDHLALYGRAQSDHSKVFVIDGAGQNPVAFVGSKNLTDSSGAFCFDEVAEIHGPLAAVVLDDYYWDMKEALIQKMTKSYPGYIEHLASKGWAKIAATATHTQSELVTEILRPFDLLNRSADGTATGFAGNVNEQGKSIARTGLNNVDSTRSSAVDQVIQAILAAQTKVFIKDQFLFDRNVVSALIRRKREVPTLDVRVILEPLNVTTPAGLPNLLYLEPMTEAGIRIKWKRTQHSDKISQEYHMKTISVDGSFVISGSANKDPNTMYGAFREQQVEIYDPVIAQLHDQDFENTWSNANESSAVWTEHNFEVPYGMKGLDGRELTPSEFVRLVRGVFGLLYDAQVY